MVNYCYLQQQLLQKRKVIFCLSRPLQAEEPTKEPIYLAASPNLLTALENIRIQLFLKMIPPRNCYVIQNLLNFSMDEQWRLESLRLAHEQINEDFTIQEDPL